MSINGNSELPFHTTRPLKYSFKVLKIQHFGEDVLEWEHHASVTITITVKKYFILPGKIINAHIPSILLGWCVH